MSSPARKESCPVCGRVVAINKDGASHRSHDPLGGSDDKRCGGPGTHCKGTHWRAAVRGTR